MLLHRDENKRSIYEHLPSLAWSAPLRAWITADPTLIQHIQQSKEFIVVDQKGDISRLQNRLDLKLDQILRVLDEVPVCAEGVPHAEKRKSIAQHIANQSPRSLEEFRKSCAHLCEIHLSEPKRFDFIADFMAPLVKSFTTELSGLTLAYNKDEPVPAQILDGALGPSRREHLNAVIGALWQLAEQTCPAHQRNNAVSLAIFGSDTVLGSLALSVMDQVCGHADKRLCDIPWTDKITRTAVPFIERTATQTMMIGDQSIQQGDVVRLYLDRYAFENEDKRDAFFGTGRHVCLGRAITHDAWRILCRCLSQIPLFMHVDEIKLRNGDYMFLLPESIYVSTYR